MKNTLIVYSLKKPSYGGISIKLDMINKAADVVFRGSVTIIAIVIILEWLGVRP